MTRGSNVHYQCIAIVLAAAATPALGAAGDLDRSFGTHGIASVATFTGTQAQAVKVTEQPDGAIVVVANHDGASLVARLLERDRFRLKRFNGAITL